MGPWSGKTARWWCSGRWWRGIALRSHGDVGPLLQRGQLVWQVLPDWRQEANIWAVYPTRLERSGPKVRGSGAGNFAAEAISPPGLAIAARAFAAQGGAA